MALLRLRYRPKPIQPELQDGKENVAFSLAKKDKPPDVDPYADIKKVVHEDPIFLPSHTQKRRIEVTIDSDEVGYRSKVQPTVYERIKIQREWAQEQLQEEKYRTKHEAIKRKADKEMAKVQQSIAEFERQKAAGSVGHNAGDLTVQELSDELDEQLAVLEQEDEQLEEAGENAVVDTAEMDTNAGQELLKKQITEIKERKVLAMRNTTEFHAKVSLRGQRLLYWKLLAGWKSHPGNSKNTTFIYDWLILGRKDVATNLQTLLSLKITHILNVTHDVKNGFFKHFVYEKVAIRDSEEEDISKHFSKMVDFIKRCEDCKGRILVHCTAGSSRAPTAVIAYLMLVKGLPLVDAYRYVCILRSFVKPNNRFLYQLAMLEVSLGEGCSVYYHADWRFYEFNLFRAKGVEERDAIGLYRTIRALYHVEEEEIFQTEAN